jgi:ADP-ribose pyrophosphatase YjhB (NUDIX family)
MYYHKTWKWKMGVAGGTVEIGETWQETLGREIFEETGCRILRYQPFGAYRIVAEQTTFRVVCWADVERVAEPNDPDGERGIVEVRRIPYSDAVKYYRGVDAHFGALYLLSHEIRS